MTSTVAFYTPAHIRCNEVYDSLISYPMDAAVFIVGFDLGVSSSTLYVRNRRSETVHVDRV